MAKVVYKKETYLSVIGEPTNHAKNGVIHSIITLVECTTKAEAQKENPDGVRIRKTYEFTLDEYNTHGDDIWKQGVSKDPELTIVT